MIRTVGLELKWLPKEIGSLFYDDIDHQGLVYWYVTVKKMVEEINPKK